MKPLFLALLPALALAASAVTSARPVLEIMYQVRDLRNVLEAGLPAEGRQEELQTKLRDLETLFEELKGGYRSYYGGSPEDWEALCEAGLAAVREAGDQLATGAPSAFERVLARLEEIEKDSHDKFRPGFLRRLMRLFSKNRYKEDTHDET